MPITTRQLLEDDVRRYFAKRGLFLELYPFYLPQKRTLEQLPLWLDYWLEGRPPPLPGKLELVSVEWCPRCQPGGDDPLPNYPGFPPPESAGVSCVDIRSVTGRRVNATCAAEKLRRWGLRRRQPKRTTSSP